MSVKVPPYKVPLAKIFVIRPTLPAGKLSEINPKNDLVKTPK